MEIIAFRLKPGADLKASIEEKIIERKVRAGFIISCVGGLQKACVRMAGAKPNRQDIRTMADEYEIVSLTGTVSTSGTHLHISFSNKEGRVTGGHLMAGTLVRPTAEIVIGIENSLSFKRQPDSDTGWNELVVE